MLKHKVGQGQRAIHEGVSKISKSRNIPRRRAVKLGAAAAALPLVHIRTAGAAGKLNIGFWDHWVPGANDVMQKQVNAWAEKNKVEVTPTSSPVGRQAAADPGGRNAGQGRPRRDDLLHLGRAELRRLSGAGGRRDAAAHRRQWRR